MQTQAAAPTSKPAGIGATERIAAYVSATRFEQIPRETRETAKRLLLDGIGCMITGTRGSPANTAERAYRQFGGVVDGGGGATVMVSGRRASARDAAFVNGITLYSVGVNDIHIPSGSHPGGCVVPAVLAVGEWKRAHGPEMLTAMITGYDVMGRLGRAMHDSHWQRGFHPTGTFGAFGATSAVACLLGLDAARTTAALGIAGSQAAGLKAYQTDGSFTLVFHAERSAQNGVEAALLASEGFTGPRTVLEDAQGFVAALSDFADLSALTSELGVTYEVDHTSFRPFFGCSLTITASAATAELMRQNPGRRPDDLAQLIVRCHPKSIEEVGKPDPDTLSAARLSMEFNLALVLLRGDVFVGDVSDADLWNPQLRSLLPKVRLTPDESIPLFGSAVDARFNDGMRAEVNVAWPKGDPARAPMSWDDTIEKFRKLVSAVGAAERFESVIACVRDIEAYDGFELARRVEASIHARA